MWLLLLISAMLIISPYQPSAAEARFQQDTRYEWTEFANLSDTGGDVRESEPKMVSDLFGYTHVFWSDYEVGTQAIYYARMIDGVWEGPLDVIANQYRALVASVAADSAGYLYVVWMGLDRLYVSRSHHEDALTGQGWKSTILAEGVSAGSGWAADMIVDDGGSLHIAYGDAVSGQVYVVHSVDGGVSWTEPKSVGDVGVYSKPEGTSEVRLASDGKSRLYLVWNARVLPRGWPGTRLFYAFSPDDGLSWSSPLLIDHADSGDYAEDRGPFFPTIFVRNGTEVHITWSGAPMGQRWHQWSADGGAHWFPKTPMTVFNDTASGAFPGTTGFTDMIADSSGQLYAVTTIGDSGSPRLARWLGDGWGDRYDTPYAGRDCEDPRLAISEGNQLHLVCLEQGTEKANDVWFVGATLNSPHIQRAPVPGYSPPQIVDSSRVFPATLVSPPSSSEEHFALVASNDAPMVGTKTPLLIVLSFLAPLLLVVGVFVWQIRRRRN